MNETYQSQSSLLIDEPPMLMLPSLAKVLKSADKAIIVQQIHYWLQIKRKAKDTRSFKEGRWWVYNSFREWHKQFIWISERTIQRHFKDLVAQGIIIVGNFNNQNYDRTNWYTLSYERLNELTMTYCRDHYDRSSYPPRQVDVMDNDKLSGVLRQIVVTNTIDYQRLLLQRLSQKLHHHLFMQLTVNIYIVTRMLLRWRLMMMLDGHNLVRLWLSQLLLPRLLNYNSLLFSHNISLKQAIGRSRLIQVVLTLWLIPMA